MPGSTCSTTLPDQNDERYRHGLLLAAAAAAAAAAVVVVSAVAAAVDTSHLASVSHHFEGSLLG